jgi:hypothetical protein
MTTADTHDTERLLRHLRAMSAVNHQLHAQLEGQTVRAVGRAGAHTDDLLGDADMFATVVVKARRVGIAGAWLEQLQLRGGRSGEIYVARTPARDAFVIEGSMRRAVKSGLLVLALAKVFGPIREVSASDLDRFSEGPPVEVLEAGSGPAFVVVGGQRLPIRGLPLPYVVTNDEANLFPIGKELNVSYGALSSANSSRSKLGRVKRVVSEEGPVKGSAKVARKAVRRARKSLRGTRN